jgi:peptidoglycan/xylan/chitin deacetylase (PgdA/CDA1 family)
VILRAWSADCDGRGSHEEGGMTRLTVLMYHALSNGKSAIGDADPHYTLTRSRFCEQLQMIRATGLGLCSVRNVIQGDYDVRNTPSVVLTFDDGHSSNKDAVAELVQHGGHADFFVNPSTIGRANSLSWTDLREFAALGMSVQSHGYTHRYLDELSRTEVEHELVISKKEIEDRLGQVVQLFAPAGGRMPEHLLDLAQSVGYTAVCSSRPDTWIPGENREIPRLAVLASTTNAQLYRWVTGARVEMMVQRARYQTFRVMKRLLGNQVYEQVRVALLGRTR